MLCQLDIGPTSPNLLLPVTLKSPAALFFPLCSPFLPRATIKYKRLADCPVKLKSATVSIVIGNRVYIGGGLTRIPSQPKKSQTVVKYLFSLFQVQDDATKIIGDDSEHQIFMYDLSTEEWNPLPPCPVRYFGLGEWEGHLVTAGGVKRASNEASYEVYEYDEETEIWKLSSIPPMPPKRVPEIYLPSFLVHHSSSKTLIFTEGKTVTIFNQEEDQWYRTTLQKPTNRYPMLLQNTMYLVSMENGLLEGLAVDQLLEGLFSMATQDGYIYAWKTLYKMPLHICSVDVVSSVAGSSVAIGHTSTKPCKCIFIYDPHLDHWQYIADVPDISATYDDVVSISATDFLLIGTNSNIYRGSVQPL